MEIIQEGTEVIDEEDQYLLDRSIEEINAWKGAKKKIWIRSMQAAKNLKRKRIEEDADHRQTRHKQKRRQQNVTSICRPQKVSRKRHHDINTTGQHKKVRKK